MNDLTVTPDGAVWHAWGRYVNDDYTSFVGRYADGAWTNFEHEA